MITLTPDWKEAWRLWSIRLTAVMVALQTYIFTTPNAVLDAWQALPPELKGFIPANYLQLINVALAISVMIARLIPQPKAMEKIAIKQAIKEADKAEDIAAGKPIEEKDAI